MRLKAIVISLFVLVTAAAFAQPSGYPSQPLTFIVPYGAGGMTDVSSRILASAFEDRLGQRVDVVNRPGAGGYLGLTEGLREDADGHTLIAVTTDIFANTVLLDRDFELDSVGFLGSFMPQERVLFSHVDKPFSTFEEFVEYAKSNRVTFADGGALWSGNVVKAMALEAGLDVAHIPFESGAAGSAALLGGHVDIGETGVGTAAWQAAKEGELNILAILSDGTLAPFGYPEVENLEQKGFSNVVRMYYGVAVSGDVPEEVRIYLESVLEDILADPEIVASLEALDLTPRFIGSAEYESIVTTVLVEAAGLRDFLAE